MDFTVLLTPPALIAMAVLAIVFLWIGLAIGKSNESKRKELALAEAGEERTQAIADLETEHADKVATLQKAGENEIAKLKQEHSAQTDQNNAAHQTLVDSVKQSHNDEIKRLTDEHSGLVKQLNEANIANINALKKTNEEQVDALNTKHAAGIMAVKEEMESTISLFKDEHAKAIAALQSEHQKSQDVAKAEYERQIQAQATAAAKEADGLNQIISGLESERDALKDEVTELTGTVAELNENIKEAKMQNMFSVSKSGERLIRVVRSVQELASELDETSRTVTGGDYSFFNEIKDQRDKETVLSLTGIHPTVHEKDDIEDVVDAVPGEDVEPPADAPAGDSETADSPADKP